MSTFTFSPTYGATENVAPKVKKAQFGDGYQQRTGDGINRTARLWSLTFEGTKADIDAIDLFLETEDGITSFDYTPPCGPAGKFICSGWSSSINQFNNWSLSANFQEVFGS